MKGAVAILDQKSREAHPQLDTAGKALGVKNQTTVYNFGTSAPLFLAVLKTLLYVYALCSMKDGVGSQLATRIPFARMVF